MKINQLRKNQEANIKVKKGGRIKEKKKVKIIIRRKRRTILWSILMVYVYSININC